MQETRTTGTSRPANRGFILVTALLIVDSLHFVFARLLLPHISPGVSAMYVLAVGTAEVALFGLIRRRLHLRMLGQRGWFFLAIGFLVAASTNINYEAVAFIDPGTASLLSQASILFGLGLGLFWLREKLTLTQVGGALLAVTGVFVITFQPGAYLRLGSLLVLCSAFMYALHAAIAKRYGEQIDFVDFFFFRLLFTTSMLLLFAVVRRALVWPSARAWPLLVLVGTVDVVISRTLYYVVLRRFRMSIHSIVLTLSPVAAVLWSLLLFDTLPTLQEFLGGAAVILGVLIVTMRQQAREG
ncbi:MAG: EamA family transporter [Anaerolineae bacterium]|nr:EamA family transporter [Anaerolineae bacterium]